MGEHTAISSRIKPLHRAFKSLHDLVPIPLQPHPLPFPHSLPTTQFLLSPALWLCPYSNFCLVFSPSPAQILPLPGSLHYPSPQLLMPWAPSTTSRLTRSGGLLFSAVQPPTWGGSAESPHACPTSCSSQPLEWGTYITTPFYRAGKVRLRETEISLGHTASK